MILSTIMFNTSIRIRSITIHSNKLLFLYCIRSLKSSKFSLMICKSSIMFLYLICRSKVLFRPMSILFKFSSSHVSGENQKCRGFARFYFSDSRFSQYTASGFYPKYLIFPDFQGIESGG